MKRIFSLLVMLSCVVVGVWAHGRMSAATRLALLHQHHSSSRIASANDQMVRAFITVDSPQAIDQLHKLGVKVHARFSNRVTASMPLSSVAQLCQVSGVRQLSVAQLAQVCNDSALADAHVPPLASGVGFGMPYDGRGVVIGVIDTGVDFNHINLCDATGRSRVVAAYLPQDSTGISPIIHGDTLPGSHYTTPTRQHRMAHTPQAPQQAVASMACRVSHRKPNWSFVPCLSCGTLILPTRCCIFSIMPIALDCQLLST